MLKKMTCIECPKGCSLCVDVENSKALKVIGHECPKGEIYAVKEIECPVRILTSTVMTKGFDLKFLPVRTDKPIQKSKTFDAIHEIRKIIIQYPVKAGDVIIKDFMGMGVNLIAARCLNNIE